MNRPAKQDTTTRVAAPSLQRELSKFYASRSLLSHHGTIVGWRVRLFDQTLCNRRCRRHQRCINLVHKPEPMGRAGGKVPEKTGSSNRFTNE